MIHPEGDAGWFGRKIKVTRNSFVIFFSTESTHARYDICDLLTSCYQPDFAILSLHLRNARENSGLSSQKHRDFRRFQHKTPYDVKILVQSREYYVQTAKKVHCKAF